MHGSYAIIISFKQEWRQGGGRGATAPSLGTLTPRRERIGVNLEENMHSKVCISVRESYQKFPLVEHFAFFFPKLLLTYRTSCVQQ